MAGAREILGAAMIQKVTLCCLLGGISFSTYSDATQDQADAMQQLATEQMQGIYQLDLEQKKKLENMVEQSKSGRIDVPEPKTHQQLSKRQTEELRQITKKSQEAITPILKQEVKALLNSEQVKLNRAEGERLARKVLNLPQEGAGLPQSGDPKVDGGQVILFVSSSMPLETLRNYARDLAKVKGVMVLRGGVEGLTRIGPTVAFAQEITKLDPSCQGNNCQLRDVGLLIDPLLFRHYNVTSVPAIAFQPKGITSWCDLTAVAPAGDLIYGDVSLRGALDRLQQLGTDGVLKKSIDNMRRKV